MADHEEQEVVALDDPRLDAANFVIRRKSDWKNSLQDKRDTWARLDKRYHNYREDLEVTDDKATNEPRANIGVPLAAETVDTAVARIHDNFFRHPPYGKIWGREPEDQLKSEIVQMVIDYQQQATYLSVAGHRVVRDAVKYGTGFGKIHFKRETKVVPEPVTIMGIPVGMRKVEKTVMQSPVLEHIHVQDMFFPADAKDLDCAEGVIHRTWQSLVDLETATDGLGLPLYDPMVLEGVANASSKSTKDDDENHQTEYTTRKIEEGGLQKDGKYPVLEYTGKLPRATALALVQRYFPEDDPYGDWIVTVIDGNPDPLRVEPSPYLTNRRMYIAAKVIDDPGWLCGISLLEFVERLGLTIDELYNIALDNMNFVINKQYYINELAGVDEADVVSSPGKVIRGKRPPNEAISVISTPDVGGTVFILLNALIGHYKEYTGVTNPILGQSERGEQTATEIASLVSHSSTRLGQFERILEDTFMRPLFERWVVLNQQFIDQEFVIRAFEGTQPVYPKVAPEKIQGVFDFRFEGAAKAESVALLTGQIMQLLQINATQPVPIYNPIYLGKKILSSWGWADADEAMNPAFAEQFQMFQQLQALRNIGETAQALTPQQQAQAKTGGGNAAKQGNAARPENTQTNQDFRSALTAVKEAALPQGGDEA